MTVFSLCVCCAHRPTPLRRVEALGCVTSTRTGASFLFIARHSTVRLAEVLAQYLSSLMRKAESLATSETECLLYTTYWFRPLLSELIGAATESWEVNRARVQVDPSRRWLVSSLGCDPTLGLIFSPGSRPYLHGFQPAGPA